MKIFLSKLLYYIGDFVSVLLYWDAFCFLYPLYKKVMVLSSDLDEEGEVWDSKNKDKI